MQKFVPIACSILARHLIAQVEMRAELAKRGSADHGAGEEGGDGDDSPLVPHDGALCGGRRGSYGDGTHPAGGGEVDPSSFLEVLPGTELNRQREMDDADATPVMPGLLHVRVVVAALRAAKKVIPAM